MGSGNPTAVDGTRATRAARASSSGISRPRTKGASVQDQCFAPGNGQGVGAAQQHEERHEGPGVRHGGPCSPALSEGACWKNGGRRGAAGELRRTGGTAPCGAVDRARCDVMESATRTPCSGQTQPRAGRQPPIRPTRADPTMHKRCKTVLSLPPCLPPRSLCPHHSFYFNAVYIQGKVRAARACFKASISRVCVERRG